MYVKMFDHAKFFPVLLCSWHNSPNDALVALKVPATEVMNLVISAWGTDTEVILTELSGERPVAAVFFSTGCWAACNAYSVASPMKFHEATRYLHKMLKANRSGWLIAVMASGNLKLIR